MNGLMLDARQRAMLEEMGVKVWWPAHAPEAAVMVPVAPEAAEAAPDPVPAVDEGPPAWIDDMPPQDMPPPAAEPPAFRQDAPPAAPVRRAATDAPRATAPAPSVRSGAAPTVRIEPAQRLYLPPDAGVDAPAPGGWLVLVDMPPGPDGRHGAAFAGDAGRLLDQMLRALRLHAGPAPVHLQRVHRPAPGVPQGEDDEPFEAGFDHACRELTPRMVLALGPLAAQQLLGAQPLGRLRAQVGRCADGRTAVVASYAPAYLLRTPADKARAWADLCLAAAEFERLAAAAG